MPLGGILTALFAGWLIKPQVLTEDLAFNSPLLFNTWLRMIRAIAPLAILGTLCRGL